MKTFLCKKISVELMETILMYLASHGVVTISDMDLIKTSLTKKAIIEQARQWSLYFCRLFPISVCILKYNFELLLML